MLIENKMALSIHLMVNMEELNKRIQISIEHILAFIILEFVYIIIYLLII